LFAHLRAAYAARKKRPGRRETEEKPQIPPLRSPGFARKTR
jgi:hypothetical protein